jgi:hypothetical protein
VLGMAWAGVLDGEAVAAALAVMSSTNFWMSTAASSSLADAEMAAAAATGAASGEGTAGVCSAGAAGDGLPFGAVDGGSEGVSERLACSDGVEVP